ncbi:MAG: hypothetical protein K8H88_00330 [Sandaracinaceae bacterium]|nr:hypothetical protein [Sandaracinaceae bacterium]
MAQHLRLASLSIVLVLASACGGTLAQVRLRHPLLVGQVDPNGIPMENVREERGRGLPEGVLVDSAELRLLTPEQICIYVSIWGTNAEPARSDFAAYRIALLNDQAGVEVTSPQVMPEQGTSAMYQGWRSRVVPSSSTFVRRVREPFTWQVSQQPATLCFPNGGFVNPSTTRLRLELGNAGSGAQINFEWAFDSNVAAPPPQ